uniref:Uncharacterized protein n=1 Tax=Arundo donax TaxID=35708 RepID=A0A0A8Z469_ARUDO
MIPFLEQCTGMIHHSLIGLLRT